MEEKEHCARMLSRAEGIFFLS